MYKNLISITLLLLTGCEDGCSQSIGTFTPQDDVSQESILDLLEGEWEVIEESSEPRVGAGLFRYNEDYDFTFDWIFATVMVPGHHSDNMFSERLTGIVDWSVTNDEMISFETYQTDGVLMYSPGSNDVIDELWTDYTDYGFVTCIHNGLRDANARVSCMSDDAEWELFPL